MTMLTESRDLYSVTHNREAGTATVVWMHRIFRDGVELESAREAETATFDNQADLDAALGADAAYAANLFERAAGDKVLTPEEVAAQYVTSVQRHMDSKARERRYDNIVSACSYAGAPNAFQAESQAFLQWRAACWAHLYQMQEQVQAGQRSLPSMDELIAEMPTLSLAG